MPYERRPDMKHNLFTGVIGSLFSMLQFLASPIMGAASDVYGRKPVLVISMVKIHDDNLINIQCIYKYDINFFNMLKNLTHFYCD